LANKSTAILQGEKERGDIISVKNTLIDK